MSEVAAHRGGLRLWGRIPQSYRLPLGVYAVTQAILFVWWLAFFPGLTSYDSVAYVWQATTSNWMTNHSVLYTSLVWVSLQLSGGLGLLSLAQTVALAAGVAYAVTGLRALGAPSRWLAVAAVVVAALPPLGTFIVFIWKDVAFVICQVYLLGTLARLVVARRTPRPGTWYADRRLVGLLVALFVEYALLGLFRQNGFLVVLVAAVMTALLLAGIRTILLAVGGAAIVLSFVMNLWVYPALGATPAKSDLLLNQSFADIAVAYHDRPGDFTARDKDVMARVAPLQFWSDSANCYAADPTTNARPWNRAAANANARELFDLWIRLLKRMPDEIIDARFCRGSIAWKIDRGPDRWGTVLTPLEGSRNLHGFGSRMKDNPWSAAIYLNPPIGALHEAGALLRKASDADTLKPIMWRGATWSYIGYAALFVFARRRRERAVWVLGAVALSNQLVVLVNIPSQLVRYMLGPMYVGILLLPLFAKDRAPVGAGPGEAGATVRAVDAGPPADQARPTEPAPARAVEPEAGGVAGPETAGEPAVFGPAPSGLAGTARPRSDDGGADGHDMGWPARHDNGGVAGRGGFAVDGTPQGGRPGD
jgi:hypothetical protein